MRQSNKSVDILTLLPILLFFFFAPSSGAGQNGMSASPVGKRADITLEHAGLRDAILELERQYEVHVTYDDRLMDKSKKVELKLEKVTLETVLEKLLEDTRLDYAFITPDQIVLSRKEDIEKRYGEIVGRVIDAASKEPLEKANVEVLDTWQGAASDQGGYYRIRLPEGAYDLRASVIGYAQLERENVEVKAGKTKYVMFRLRQTVLQMEGVSISGNRGIPRHMEIEPSVVTVTNTEIKDIPAVGEPDLFRAIQALPGVSAPNDYTNELHVRGGEADQNLVMLDGAVIYNPFHLFGFAGAFNPDIIEQVNLSLGGFSARYGDRLSSVIDVQTKSGDHEDIEGDGNFSLMSSKLTLSGRLSRKVSWVVSGRRSYHDLAARTFMGLRVPYYFYDYYGKVSTRPNEANFLNFSIFRSKDQFNQPEGDDRNQRFYSKQHPYWQEKDTQYDWNNGLLAVQWQHRFSDKHHFEVKLARSTYKLGLLVDRRYYTADNADDETKQHVEQLNRQSRLYENLKATNDLADLGGRVEWRLESEKRQFDIGVGFNSIWLDYSWKGLLNQLDQDHVVVLFDQAPNDFDYHRRLDSGFGYGETSWSLSKKVQARIGLRLEHRSTGQHSLAPRFNLSYEHRPELMLKFAAGRYYQALFSSLETGQLQASRLLFTPDKRPLESADHFILGMNYRKDRWQLSADLYFKRMHLLRAISGVPEFDTGHANAYGLEITLQKPGDRFNLDLSYVLSFSKREFSEQSYYSSADQRHLISLTGTYFLGRNWRAGFRWNLASGRPFTPKTLIYRDFRYNYATGLWERDAEFPGHGESDLEYPDTRNQARYPVYHRLDLSVSKRFQKRGWAISPYLQVLNVYFRKNVLLYESALSYPEPTFIDRQYIPAEGTFKRSIIPMMPILPTIGLSLDF